MFKEEFEHWLIQEDGRVVDTYKSITNIFECDAEYFFQKCNMLANEESQK